MNKPTFKIAIDVGRWIKFPALTFRAGGASIDYPTVRPAVTDGIPKAGPNTAATRENLSRPASTRITMAIDQIS